LAAALLGLGASVGGGVAIADETYKRTAFYEDGAAVTVIAFSQDGARIAFAMEGRNVRIRETGAGNEIALLAVPSSAEDDEYLHSITFSPDGALLATVSRDKTVRVWDIGSSSQLMTLEHPSLVVSVRFSPDGTRLAALVGDATVRLWDVTSGRELAVLDHPTEAISGSFSQNGANLVTGCTDGTAHVWEVDTGTKIAILQGHGGAVGDVRFSPDGSRVVTASRDDTVRLWDATSGSELLVLRHALPVQSAALSADGARIVTGAGTEAHVFDAGTGQEIAVLRGHEYEVLTASFSPDGTRIVTGSADNSLRVWDAGSFNEIAALEGHNYQVEYAAFSPDGQRILSVGGAQGIVWTKVEPLSLPESSVGLWFHDISSPEDPGQTELIRSMCIATPIRIDRDGLVVLFEGYDPEPPHAVFHMRCSSDMSCEMFSGEPVQGAELFGEGSLSFSGDTGTVCLTGDCRPLSRCPPITWTEKERASGFADRWEASVNPPQ
jgi:WD40 repeat protein